MEQFKRSATCIEVVIVIFHYQFYNIRWYFVYYPGQFFNNIEEEFVGGEIRR